MSGDDSSSLLGRVEANFLAHLTYPHRSTPGMRVVEGAGWVLSDSGLPDDSFNTVYLRGLPTPADGAGLAGALSHFRSRGLPFAVWVAPGADEGTADALAGLGLRLAEEEPGLALDLRDWRPREGDGPVEVLVARDEDRLAAYGRVLAALREPPDENIAAFFRQTADAVLVPDCPLSLLVGYAAGVPVATCELVVVDGVAGLYNVATLGSHQRRGIGTAMVAAALDEALRRGCDLAILQASPDGLPVYRRLGFREFGLYRVFNDVPS
jgi:GNAT superfamily N-acetyltransferase